MTPISSITSGRIYIAPGRNDRVDPLTRVADALDLSYGTLKDQLDIGRSLQQIAAAQGVPHDRLVAAAKEAGLPATSVVAQPEKATPSRGENAGLRDEAKLTRLGRLLGMDAEHVSAQATSASSLVTLVKDKGVDLYALRTVLDSGDLLDVIA